MDDNTAELKRFYEHGEAQGGYSHMVVAMDSFDYTVYPIYVPQGQDPRDHTPTNGDRTMECYDLSLGWEAQSKGRVQNWGQRPLQKVGKDGRIIG